MPASAPSSLHMVLFLLPTGVAGSVATVLHDAIMNPAEGKNSFPSRIEVIGFLFLFLFLF